MRMTSVFVNFAIRSHCALAANAYWDRLANFARFQFYDLFFQIQCKVGNRIILNVFLFEKRTKFEFAAYSICPFPANAQCDLEVYVRKSFTISQMARWSSGDDKVLKS